MTVRKFLTVDEVHEEFQAKNIAACGGAPVLYVRHRFLSADQGFSIKSTCAIFCATHFESHNSALTSLVVVAWETRNGRQYYYKKVRCGKKVVSQYIGCGPEAEIAELSVKLQAGEKNLRHESESEWDQINELLEKRQQEINRILQLAGLHKQNCGPWRKKRMQKDRITKRS